MKVWFSNIPSGSPAQQQGVVFDFVSRKVVLNAKPVKLLTHKIYGKPLCRLEARLNNM
jgi:hypothetical protein